MSLIKAYGLTANVRSRDEIKKDFLVSVEAVLMYDDATVEELASVIACYSEYAVTYLTEVATSLQEPKGASDTMKFMNSFIAELSHKVGIHYYHMEGSYSIIDKAVQTALDNAGIVTTEQVVEYIQEIEDSYLEPEVEEVGNESTH